MKFQITIRNSLKRLSVEQNLSITLINSLTIKYQVKRFEIDEKVN